MLYVLLGLITVGVWLFCLFDVLTTDEGDVRFLPKFGWFLVVLLGLQIGAALWLLFGRPRRTVVSPGHLERRGDAGSVWRQATDPPPEAPKGPDDDPDFMRNLDRRIRGDD